MINLTSGQVEQVVLKVTSDTNDLERGFRASTKVIHEYTREFKEFGRQIGLTEQQIKDMSNSVMTHIERMNRSARQGIAKEAATNLMKTWDMGQMVSSGMSASTFNPTVRSQMIQKLVNWQTGIFKEAAEKSQREALQASATMASRMASSSFNPAVRSNMIAMMSAFSTQPSITRAAGGADMMEFLRLSGGRMPGRMGGPPALTAGHFSTRAATPAELAEVQNMVNGGRSPSSQRFFGSQIPDMPGTVMINGKRVPWSTAMSSPYMAARMQHEGMQRAQAQADAYKKLYGGSGDPNDPNGGQWNWKSSIIAAAFGRIIGGRFGGLGGLIGGGLGGPIGGALGVGAGLGLDVGFKGIDLAISGISYGLEQVINLTYAGARAAALLGIEYERTLTTFQIMTGSKQAGTDLFRQVRQLAIQTPYSSRQLSQQGGVLMGYGIDRGSVIPSLSRLGDIAGGDPDRMSRLVLAFSQVMSHGKFMGQELRQFAEAGIGAEDFAKTANMSTREFRDAMERGEISANVMVKTINRLTSAGGRYADMSKEQLKTVGGAWSQLKETAEDSLAKIGVQLFQKFDVAGRLNRATDWLAGLEKKIEPFVNWLERGATAIVPLQDGVVGIAYALGDMTKQFENNRLPKWEEIESDFGSFADTVIIGVTRMSQVFQLWTLHVEHNFRVMRAGVNFMMGSPLGKAMSGIGLGDALGVGTAGMTLGMDDTQKAERQRILDALNSPVPSYRAEAAKARQMREWETYFSKTFGFGSSSTPAGKIPLKMEMDPITQQWVSDLRSGMAKGSNPYDVFQREIGIANKAINGPIAHRDLDAFGMAMKEFNRFQGLEGELRPLRPGEGVIMGRDALERINRRPGAAVNPHTILEPGSGVMGFDFMADMMIKAMKEKQRQISIVEQREGVFNAFEKLANSVGKQIENQMAPAALRGSQEAAEIINRSMRSEGSFEQEVMRVLNEANRQAEERKRVMDEVLKVLQARGIVVEAGKEK